MANLLKETIEGLRSIGLEESDVLWVGGTSESDEQVWMTWDEFKSVSDVEYDEGYGLANVILSLIIVGKDWWLERFEYDGSECWDFKKLPEKPEKHEKFDPMDKWFYRKI